MNLTIIAVGTSVVLFAVAAVDQYLKGSSPAAALYACFCLTNSASLWLTLSTK